MYYIKWYVLLSELKINKSVENQIRLDEEIIKALKKSEEEIENGEGIESDKAFKELRKKYAY